MLRREQSQPLELRLHNFALPPLQCAGDPLCKFVASGQVQPPLLQLGKLRSENRVRHFLGLQPVLLSLPLAFQNLIAQDAKGSAPRRRRYNSSAAIVIHAARQNFV